MTDSADWVFPSPEDADDWDEPPPERRRRVVLLRGQQRKTQFRKHLRREAEPAVLPTTNHELKISWSKVYGPRRMEFTMTSWAVRQAWRWWW